MVVPIFINTPTGTVSVFGHEHVSKKMLEVIGTMLSHDAFETVYHGIKSIVFRTDNYPKKDNKSVMATFSPDVEGISINLQKTAERSIERSIEHKTTSVLALWWIEMIMNFAHEIHHGVRWNTNRDELHNDEKKREEEETRAEKYSEGLLIDLAKEYDVEPPKMNDETWFSKHIEDFLKDKDTDNEWKKKQTSMLEDEQIWVSKTKDGRDIIINSFKDLVCLLDNGNTEAEEWNKPTIEVDSTVLSLDEQLNGQKVTIDATGKIEAPKATMIPIEEKVEDIDLFGPFEEDSFQAEENTEQTGTDQMAEVARIAQQVYTKMYDRIFSMCEPQKDSDIGFANPEAVCSNPIPLTEEESKLFPLMNHLDINGRWCTDISTTKGLIGKVMKNTKLPAYEVYLKVNDVVHKRMFMPQNPAKKNSTGQLTSRAIEARAGNSIAYAFNPLDNTASKWGPSIINGKYNLPRKTQ